MSEPSEKQVFRPPEQFLKASLARQERLKELKNQRKTSKVTENELSAEPDHVAPAPQPQQNVKLPSTQKESLVQPNDKGKEQQPVAAKISNTHQKTTSVEPPKVSMTQKGQADANQQRQPQPRQAEPTKVRQEAPNNSPNKQQSKKAENTSMSPKSTKGKLPAAPKVQAPSSPVVNNTTQKPSTKSPMTSPIVTSKTYQEIEKIRKDREERRKTQAQVRQVKQEWEQSGVEGEMIGYRYLIDQFRESVHKEWTDEQDDLEPGDDEELSTVRVCVRKRPMNRRENDNQFDVITCRKGAKNHPNAAVFVHEPKSQLDMTKVVETHQFKFDHVFDETCDNEKIFNYSARPLVKMMFTPGGRATFFCYGQTGSGKTHTIFGKGERAKGIFQYTCELVLQKLSDFNYYAEQPLILTLRFFEIYSGRIFDLFNRRNKVMMMENKDGQAHVACLKEIQVSTMEEILNWLDIGEKARTTGATEANPESSRSHAIFQLTLRHLDVSSEDITVNSIFGQFSLIDLAGSERASEANARDRTTRIEGAEINKSLLALKECIRAFNNPNSKHVPFRASKLTQILRDSLMPHKNSRYGTDTRASVMMTTISPNSDSVEHTLNTLRYADRAKELRGGTGADGEMVLEPLVYDPVEMAHAQSRKNSKEISSSTPIPKKKTTTKVEEVQHTESQPANSKPKTVSTKSGEKVKSQTQKRTEVPVEENVKQPLQKQQNRAMSYPEKVEKEETKPQEKVRVQQPPKQFLDTPPVDDSLIRMHVSCLQESLHISQLEETLLNNLDTSDAGFNRYVNGLGRAVEAKLNLYLSLKRRIDQFKSHLEQLKMMENLNDDVEQE